MNLKQRTDGAMETREGIKDELIQIASAILGVEADEITENSYFRSDLGADSLDEVEMLIEMEKSFGVQVEDGVIEWYDPKTVGEAVDMFHEILSKQ